MRITGEHGPTLIVGSTGFIGRFIAEASLKTPSTGPTYVLTRPGTLTPSKTQVLKTLQDRGAIVIHGSMSDGVCMENVLKEYRIKIVICAVGGGATLDQLVLINAIKAVGTVKRFLPSEFGHDIDRADPVEPALTMYKEKRKVRRAIEEARIPYTYICCNSITSWPYHDNIHPSEVMPPLDLVKIYGDGTVKAYFVAGTDIGKFTMKSVTDDRALNKSLHFRPRENLLCMNELATIWESKIGSVLPHETITGFDLLAAAKEMRIPESVVAALTHDIFIQGCQVNFAIDKPTDVEVNSLYPDIPFRPVQECFDDYAASRKLL